MQIKNKLLIKVLLFLGLILFSLKVYADEFDISATEIRIDKENNIVTGIGSVEVIDKDGRIIKADKVIYERLKEFLSAEGSVNITDLDGNILNSDKATYYKLNGIIISYNN